MLWMICAVLLCLFASVPASLLAYRKLRQARVAANLNIESVAGIQEEGFVGIGEIDQWLSIRGRDRDNPVVLILHGGPGSCYSVFTPHLHSWEQHFTIVQWDQRGAGKTLKNMGSSGCGEISLARLTQDAIEVAEYLRTRLGKDRIFVLGSSIGSILGVEVALGRPDLFYAYIGTDQNVGMVRGREESHRELLNRLRTTRMMKAFRTVERIGADATQWSSKDYTTVAQWAMKSDKSGYDRTIKLLKDAVWFAPGWTLGDIRTFVKGMHFSLEQLLPEIVRYDAWARGTRFDLPMFVFHGENDVLTRTVEAQAYFADIEAPLKRMELIPGAGHFAMFLQPELFLEKLLTHVRPLGSTHTAEMGSRA